MYLPPQVEFVMSRLEENGFSAYAVGGCVRDTIMGRVPDDYDVTTSALPAQMQLVFSDCRVVETGLKHGTLTVVRDGMNIEVTTYRIDGSYADGRHPDGVTFTDRLSDDLMRRDFTINAMAYSPDRGLVDLYGGCEDLERKVIRAVGRADERFSEDALRIMRALRFASVLGFEPDAECADAVRRLTPTLGKISRERIYAELKKLLCGRNASQIMSAFPDTVSFVIPGLEPDGVLSAADSIDMINRCGIKAPLSVRTALLLQSLTAKEASSAMDSLKPSREEKRAVMSLVAEKTADIPRCEYETALLMSKYGDGYPSDFAAYRLGLGHIEKNGCDYITGTAEAIIENNVCRRISMLEIDGDDLKNAGIPPAQIGNRLSSLLDMVMRHEIPNSRDVLAGIIGND